MRQYAMLKLKMPEGMNVADFEKELIERGFEVEVTGVFNQMLFGMPVPGNFVPKSNKSR